MAFWGHLTHAVIVLHLRRCSSSQWLLMNQMSPGGMTSSEMMLKRAFEHPPSLHPSLKPEDIVYVVAFFF